MASVIYCHQCSICDMRLCLWNCCTSEHVLKYKELRKYIKKKRNNGSCIGFEIMLYFHEIKMFN